MALKYKNQFVQDCISGSMQIDYAGAENPLSRICNTEQYLSRARLFMNKDD
jgi:hypothetical protein